MPKFNIVFAPVAEKQLMKLQRFVRVRVVNAIAKLANNPHLGKQLKAELKDYRSLRVGSYRVIYFIRKKRIQIEIIRVAHRKEVYRH